ncbi:uncharacterized protein LOC132396977 isoform X3 [Hypanus sabinus]|uniref:uncharacterized protein LOC132396977 isoform X3 n=1 Tax=Hypanus sabinus TaxID=79690 RepID=UPI0028C3A7C1|nr:uncharacterized protein LOC132396977 isoform X3 [Hypanus sabinus]
MDVSLCLVLLQLTVAWNSGSGFPVEQPKYIEAVVDESVTLTCTFTHPENSSLRDIDIRWKVRKNHKTDIFRYLDNYTLKDFRGRIKFLGSPLRDKTGSIRLHRVEERDTNMYFCIVVILGEEYTGPGTVLSVQVFTAGSADPRGTLTWLYILLGVCGLALCVGLVFGIWIVKRKRSANIKKENYNLGPAVSGDKNVRQCQKDGSGLPHNYDMPNMVATEGESPEGIVYSVVQAKERPKTVRSVAHSEEKCLYMDVKFQAETQ